MPVRKNSPLGSRLATVLVVSLVTMGVAGVMPCSLAGANPHRTVKTPDKRPSLVVGIFVEGLSADYINLLRSNFGADGFNRFINDGVTIESVDFGPGIDPTAAAAMLVTGASPSVNGIPAARVWDPETKLDYPILLDPAKIGNFTDETFSPSALRVSTISDEVRIADDGLGLVHSIAPDAQTAIILAGHAGNSGFWLNDVNGKWSSSTFYRDVPTPIARRNYGVSLSSRLDTLTWTPSVALNLYPDIPDHKKKFPFKHTFPERLTNRYQAYKASAPCNREVADMAADYISTLKLGTRGVTDMLNLGFTVTPYPYGRVPDTRMETMDAYMRLDADIASIIRAVNRGPGMDHTLMFIAGTPAPASSKREDERWNIPGGVFSPRKALSLLNVYLMALHGTGEYVAGYHNGYFYLNHAFLKERQLNPMDIRRECADFLVRMSGVSAVHTIDRKSVV